MLKCMSIEICRIFHGLWNFCDFRLLQSVLLSAVTFIIIAALPIYAVAQFPGIGSEAPSGVAIEASDDASSVGADADTSASVASSSGGDSSASNGVSGVSSQSNTDGGSAGNQSSDSSIPTLNLKKQHHREHLFIKKLRFEFAAIELVERKTGLPFSRSDVPRYLDELRSDLKIMVNEAENGKITDGALKSIARDAYLIETKLNDHLDQLLEQAGQPVPRKPFFVIEPALSKEKLISGATIDALSLKFELAEFCEKALQAMGTERY
jgi:hypothetical protein